MFEEHELCDREIRALADKVVDLGVSVEESFKNAIALLFTRDWSSALAVFQSSPDIAPVTLVGQAFHLLHRWALTPDRLRTVMALQEAATEFEKMSSVIQRIAEQARSLEEDIETFFANYLGPQGHQAFYQLVHSAYVQLRGCVVALSTRQAAMAARVIEQDSVLDDAYLRLLAALRQAIAVNVESALRLTLISVIIGDIEDLGNRVTRICQRVESITQGTFADPSDSLGSAMYY